MVDSRSEIVARRLAFGSLLLACGIFAAAGGMGFAFFLPKMPPTAAKIGTTPTTVPQAKLDSMDENLLHLEIGAALLAGAIQSGQTEPAELEDSVDALRIMLDDAAPTLSRELSNRLNDHLDSVRAEMEGYNTGEAAREAESLHLLLKVQRAMANGTP